MSGEYRLLPIIIGVDQIVLEHLELDPFVMPEKPQNTPQNLAASASNSAVRLAVTDKDTKKRDWAILKGFMRGISENIRGALDLEYYKDLEHVDHGFKNVRPIDYITHLEQEHCPCDGQTVKEYREHFFRG